MPELDRFYRESQDKAAILAVTPASSEGGIRDLMAAGGYSFPVMIDSGDVGSQYGIRYVPTLFVIDAEGKIAQRIVGPVDAARLSQLVDDLSG
jgi:hypothetical protein